MGMAMKFNGEVIGWVVHDAEHTDVLVRDRNGRVHTQRAEITAQSGEFAIQTGAFCMGSGLDDPRVMQALAIG